MKISLSTKYEAENGQVLMTGSQALVRLPMAQVRRDRAAGLDTGVFISGYRGSPLGGLDKQFMGAREHYEKYDVLFQPGVNEDLALTAVWGSQQLHLSPGAQNRVWSVFGMARALVLIGVVTFLSMATLLAVRPMAAC